LEFEIFRNKFTYFDEKIKRKLKFNHFKKMFQIISTTECEIY